MTCGFCSPLNLVERVLVPRGGFEPPACPLGGDRSILLSYRGRNGINSTINITAHLFLTKINEIMTECFYLPRWKHQYT